MKIVRSDREKLVVVDFPYLVGGGMFLAALAFLGHLLWQLTQGHYVQKEVIAQAVVAGIFFIAAAIFGKRSVFEFDLTRRQLIWSRCGLLTRKGGLLVFNQITGVEIQTLAQNNSISYRVILNTTEGVLPLNDIYKGGAKQACETLRETVGQALRLELKPKQEMPVEELRRMIGAGQMINAIKMIRSERNCSLAEAKKIAEDLRSSAESPVPSLDSQPQDEAELRELRKMIDGGQMINAIKMIRSQRNCGLAEAKKIAEDLRSTGRS